MNLNINIKNKALTLGWVLGIILVSGLFWRLTQGLQSYYLLRAVNTVFISMDDPRRVSSSLPQNGGHGLYGYWYSMYWSDEKMFVFSVIHDGISIPLGAIVNSNNKVKEVIPLSANAIQYFEKLPASVIQMYITRIEKQDRSTK
jgi:hypothetical protein